MIFLSGDGAGKIKGELLHSFVPKACLSKKKPRFTNPHLIQARHYYGVALSVGKESPYIFFKLNSLDTDTPLLRTIFMVPSVSVLTGFDYT